MEDDSLKHYRKRINVTGVPVDAISPDDLEKAVKEMLSDNKIHHIMLISLKDIMRARFNRELMGNIERASLVLPLSASICSGAAFLKRKHIPELYFPFDFIIRLLGILETLRKSVYLVGAGKSVLQITESNIRSSFPGLNIVGRCAGYFPKDMEKNVVTAIKKSSPSLVLSGTGLPGGRYWITRNNSFFNPGISLWIGKSFDIFAGKRNRPAKTGKARFMEKSRKGLRQPWKLFNLFVYLYFFMLLVYYRLKSL